MIKSMMARYFEGHHLSKLEFHPGVNVIIGTSDHGKSSLIRALKWCMFNEPRGSDFCNWDVNRETSVKLEFDDGTSVSRFRTRTSAGGYRFRSEDLTSFTSGVPLEVSDAMCLGPINLMEQDDAVFLLASTGGQVSRLLNECAGLETMDRSLSSLNSSLRAVNAELARETEYGEEARNRYDGYRNVPEIRKEAQTAQTLLNELELRYRLVIAMDEMLEDWNRLEKERDSLPENLPDLELLDDQLADIRTLEKQLADMYVLTNLYGENTEAYNSVMECLEDAEDKLKKLTPDTCPLCGSKMK